MSAPATDTIHVLSPHCGLRSGSQLGGEVFERQLLLRLPDHGVVPHIGLPSSRPPDGMPAGWEVEILHPGRGLRWYAAPAAFFPYAVRQLRTGRIDLVRAHAPRFVGPSLIAARRVVGRAHPPLVVHHHHADPGFAGSVDRWVMRRAALVVVPTRAVGDELVAGGISRDRISVVSNGVELARPDASGAAWLRPPGARLLFMSRLIDRKRPLLAIETVAALAEEFPGVELVVVGRGPLEAVVRDHVQALGVGDRVQLVPRVSEETKAWLLETADVFLMPSTLEGFGLVALESQLAGTPVVAGPAAALAEVVLEETGVLVDGNPEAFVAATRSLLASPERRAALGAAGRRWAATFSWDATAAATADAYRRALAETSA